MSKYLRPLLVIGVLVAVSLAVAACERERPVIPPAAGTTASPRSTVAPSPTPPFLATQVTLSGTPGAEAGQATPVPAAQGTPAAPTPVPVMTTPGAQTGGTTTGPTFTYTVMAGDTLSSVAEKFGVSVEALVQLNGMGDANTLALGQELKIPGSASTVAGAPTPVTVVLNPGGQPGGTTTGPTFTYTVVAGDSLGDIAERFNVSVATLAQLNGITDPNTLMLGQQLRIPGAAPATTGGTPPATGATTVYTVRAGDTLSAIAQQFDTTVEELMRLNNLANANVLSEGQRLTVPASTPGGTSGGQQRSYVIQVGDTLYSIARHFGVTMAQLQAANGIADPNLIYVGQTLVIP